MLSPLLPVNEVFSTVQGEGHFTGTPATFIRVQGCPVGCPWCDTKYTWSFDLENERSRAEIFAKGTATSETFCLASAEQLTAAVKDLHVVITGGEPAQYNLLPLTELLAEAGHMAQIETSGTFPLRVDRRAWVTVSPKPNMPGGLSVKPDVLKRANEIKHVIGKAADIDTLRVLLPWAGPQAEIYLQPLSCSQKATALCIKAAAENGWKVSLQTHKMIGVR